MKKEEKSNKYVREGFNSFLLTYFGIPFILLFLATSFPESGMIFVGLIFLYFFIIILALIFRLLKFIFSLKEMVFQKEGKTIVFQLFKKIIILNKGGKMDENLEKLIKEVEDLKQRVKKIEEFLCAFPEVNSYLSIKPVDDDQLIEEAIEYAKTKGRVSASILQIQFSIGYNRAAKILKAFEEKGIIGPAIGTEPRKVLIQ